MPGIGQKGAQRIILELKDRIGPPTGRRRRGAVLASAEPAWRGQVRDGLVGLGWSAKEADKAIDAVAPDDDGRRRRRRRPAARRAARPEPGVRRDASSDDELTAAEVELPRRARRVLDAEAAGRRPRRRGGAAAAHAGRADRPGAGPRAALSWCWTRRAARGRTPDHVLLSGPPGLGKTTLAMIIAAEMSAPLRVTSGPAITHAGDLAAILSGLNEGDVLFVDEIHRMARPAEEMLYMAMEDFRVDVVIGKGPGATAIPLEIPPFTLVGATTRAGLLPGPAARPVRLHRPPGVLRARRPRADRPAQRRAARGRRSPTTARSRSPPGAAARRGSPTGCCAGSATTPRSAPTASARSTSPGGALDLYEVDRSGLDRLDRAVLDALCRRFGGGPVGLSTLAVAVGEERETVEEVAEPFLVRLGLLARTPRGRVATRPRPGSTSGCTPPRQQPSRRCSTTTPRRRTSADAARIWR